MVGLSGSHEQILIALLGAFGIVIAATVPMLWVTLSSRKAARAADSTATETRVAVEKVERHLPPNGDLLFEMVRQTNVTVNDMQAHLLQLRLSNVSLAEQLERQTERFDAHIEEAAPLEEFVRTLMPPKGGD